MEDQVKTKNKRKSIKKDEIRKSKATGHPAYIFAQEGNDFKFLGITHSPMTEGNANIELSVNPNRSDKRKAYVIKKSKRDRTNKFGAKSKTMKIAKKDKSKIRDFLK